MYVNLRSALVALVLLGAAATRIAPALGAEGASRTVPPGSSWVIAHLTRLSRLTVGTGAKLTAAEGNSLSMTVNGIGTRIAPGTYTGAVVLTPTRRLTLGASNGGPHDFRAAVFINDGKRVADQSVAAAVISGVVGDRVASDVRIDSREEKFNGLMVSGNSTYLIDGATVDFTGNGGNDFAGYGAAIMSSGNARLTVNRAHIRTTGAVRTALYIGGKSTMVVNDSDIEVRSGTLPEDYQFSIAPGHMMEVPYGLGLSGNVRATNLIDEATVYYNRSHFKSDGWGVLSSDGGGPTRMFVDRCRIETVGSGYGAYANGDAHDYFSHSTFDVADVGIILGGYGSATLTDGTIIRSKKLGVFMHQGTGGSVLSILSHSEIHSHNTAVQIKGRGGDVIVDHAVLQADNGILIQTMDNDDPIMRAMMAGGGPPGGGPPGAGPPGGGPPGGGPPGSGPPGGGPPGAAPPGMEPLSFSKDVHATLRNTELTGDIVHALTSTSDMTVSLQQATLTGAISTGVARPESGKAPERETFRQVGLVVNELGPSPTAHTLKVYLDWKSRWVVSKASYLDGLVLADGAQLATSAGAQPTLTIDGVVTPIRPGSYSGKIVLRP